jgi:glycosyltransferase involved in cell wall biosynthesis
MKIWLVTIGEPIPSDSENTRLLRTGIFAQFLAKQGHDVVWWNNRFNHAKKESRAIQSSIVLEKNLRLELLESSGYKKNISFKRFYDHIQLATNFRQRIQSEDCPDIIISSFPTMDLCKESIKYAKEKNIPVLLDLRDLWPDTFVDALPSIAQKIGKLLMLPLFLKAKSICKSATGLIGITQPFLDWGIKNANRATNSHDKVIHFGYTLAKFDVTNININIDKKENDFILCYIGNISNNWDFETINDAILLLNQRQSKRFRFIICGNGDALESFKNIAKGNQNIEFLGRINAAEIAYVMSKADLGMIPYLDIANFQNTLSNKTIEYWAGGLPVLTSVNGYLGNFIQTKSLGLIYENKNPNDLVQKIEQFAGNQKYYTEIKTNAIDIFEKSFSAEIVYHNYMKHLEFVIQNFKS